MFSVSQQLSMHVAIPEYERSVDEFKELHSVVEKERRELSEILCDLSVTGTMYYTYSNFIS